MVDGMMHVGFLEVIRVYVCDGRPEFFLVRKPDGVAHRVTGFGLLQSTWFGWGLVNARIGSNGAIFVDEKIPREEVRESMKKGET